MVLLRSLLFLFTVIIINSCTTSDFLISDDFDHGSIGHLEEIRPGFFKGSTKHWLKRDGIGDQYYWFYFKVDHAKDQKLTFELNELEGVYRRNPHIVYSNYTQPVYSYDQQNWGRIQEVSYDSALRKFEFSHQFKSEPVWIAYAHPYSVQRLSSFIPSIRQNENVQVVEIAKTKEGRGVELVMITDPKVPGDEKKVIFIMAMQHAGEDAGPFFIEGLIKYLLSEDVGAQSAREKFVYVLVPMMNPDGVYNGSSRYNMEMEDLNNIWLNSDKMQPEVKGVKNWVDGWLSEGGKVDLFLDIHNHTQLHTYNVFIFMDHKLDSLVPAMEKYWPTRLWHSEFEGSSCAYFYQKGISCGSVELTQSFAEEGDYLSISDYHNYGKGTVRGLLDYYYPSIASNK